MSLRTGAIVLCLATFGAGAAGAQTLSLPPGCTALATVQERSCRVSHLLACDGPQPLRQTLIFGRAGIDYAGLSDLEGQWLESVFYNPEEGDATETQAPDPEDPISLSGLLETGRDTYDFVTTSTAYGSTRYIGEDVLTGEEIRLDGIVLKETRWSFMAFDETGAALWHSSGTGYVSEDWRAFFGGVTQNAYSDGRVERFDDTPVEILLPGAPGFLSVVPLHGCEGEEA